MSLKRMFIGVAVATTAVTVGSGIAFATWSATGSGSGTGAAAVAESLVITPVTPTGANATMYPGGPAGAVFFNIDNPNPYPVTITGVSWGTPVSTDPSACASSLVSLDSGAPTTVSIAVPAATTLPAVQINGVLDLASTATNGCQENAFDIVMNVTGVQT
jgi:hypothetical protein